MSSPEPTAVEVAGRPPDIKAVPVRHPGRWITVVVIAVLVAMLVHTLVFSRVKRGNATETRFGWHVVGYYFLSHRILDGVLVTIELTVIGMAIGIAGGVLLAVMRLSPNPILSAVSWVYIWFFRGTPLLVQIAFWYVGIQWLYSKLSIGVPFGPEFGHATVTSLIPPFVAGFIGLGFNEAAYMAEIVRAGILSVDEGQAEAAQSLGMTRPLMMRRIVLPQAMRVIIPPTGNELISMLKNSSLVSVAAVTELFYTVQQIYSSSGQVGTYQVVPMLLVASLWYLVITSVLTIGQYYVERYYARGSSRALPPTPLQRLRSMIRTGQAPPGGMLVDNVVVGRRGGGGQ